MGRNPSCRMAICCSMNYSAHTFIGFNAPSARPNSMRLQMNFVNEAAKYVGFNAQFAACDFTVVYDYLGDGYGIVGDLEREAIRLLASREGIVVDPVYTGRAMGALLDLIRKKAFRSDETVLFWHTGGAPALFAYAKDLTPDISYRSAGSRAAPSE